MLKIEFIKRSKGKRKLIKEAKNGKVLRIQHENAWQDLKSLKWHGYRGALLAPFSQFSSISKIIKRV
jgi:hypothetical protein